MSNDLLDLDAIRTRVEEVQSKRKVTPDEDTLADDVLALLGYLRLLRLREATVSLENAALKARLEAAEKVCEAAAALKLGTVVAEDGFVDSTYLTLDDEQWDDAENALAAWRAAKGT